MQRLLQLSVSDQLSNVEGSSTVIPCEHSNNSANTEGFSVVWTLNRNAVISVLASFNGTSHSYQPRVQINQNDLSLMLHDLTANDSGEYLCNISTPHYTKLTVRTLQVGKLLLFCFRQWGPVRGMQSERVNQKSAKLWEKLSCVISTSV